MLIGLSMYFRCHQQGVHRQDVRQLTSDRSFKNVSGNFWNGIEKDASGKTVRSK